MISCIEQFRRNLQSINELNSLYSLIEKQYPILKPHAEELLRSQIVLVVSALDCFIHDCVRVGMLEIYNGQRPTTELYENFPINIGTLNSIRTAQGSDVELYYLEKSIRDKITRESYQSPRNIEAALSTLGVAKLWSKLSSIIGSPADDIKKELALLVDRRNKIAHEADFNPTAGTKYPIDLAQVSNSTEFVSKLCEAISKIIT